MSLPFASPRVPGARALFALVVADVILVPLYSLGLPWLMDQLGSLTHRQALGRISLAWLVLSALELAALAVFWRGQRGTAAAAPALAAVVLTGVLLTLDLLSALEMLELLPGNPHVALGVSLIRWVLAGIWAGTFWLALARAVGAVPAWIGPTFLSLVAVRVALSLFRILNLQTYFALTSAGGLTAWALRFAPLTFSLMCNGILLLLLWRLIKDGTAAQNPSRPPSTWQSSAGLDVLLGGALLLFGIVGTWVTYTNASSAGGGRYVIAIGPMVYGAVRLLRGLTRTTSG